MNHRQTDNAGGYDERHKARQAIDKDTPENAESHEDAEKNHGEPPPFRPNENVDNQKSAKSRKTPSHNNPVKKTPVPGAQVVKEKKAHKANINEKAKDADPKASG